MFLNVQVTTGKSSSRMKTRVTLNLECSPPRLNHGVLVKLNESRRWCVSIQALLYCTCATSSSTSSWPRLSSLSSRSSGAMAPLALLPR